jgi:hypothetical protein
MSVVNLTPKPQSWERTQVHIKQNAECTLQLVWKLWRRENSFLTRLLLLQSVPLSLVSVSPHVPHSTNTTVPPVTLSGEIGVKDSDPESLHDPTLIGAVTIRRQWSARGLLILTFVPGLGESSGHAA